MTKRILLWVLGTAALAYVVGLIINIGLHPKDFQWDFRIYYYAAQMFFQGENPYNVPLLRRLSGTPYYCTYPPGALYFYKPFLLFNSYALASQVYLFLKCFLVAFLLFLWKKYFLKEKAGWFFYPFAFLAFNGALYVDLSCGNINMFEQGLLWIAFYCFLKKRLILVGIFVCLAASFKLTPIFFLLLILLSDHPKKCRYFLRFCVIFSSFLLVQSIIFPGLFRLFLDRASFVATEYGIINPSTVAFIREGFDVISLHWRISIAPSLQFALIFFIDCTIIYLSVKAYLKLQTLNIKNKEMVALFLLCLTYALLHPRFKDYMHILLIAPAYFILLETSWAKLRYLVFFLPLFAPYPALPGARNVFSFLTEYYCLFVVYFIWVLYLRYIFLQDDKNCRCE